MPRRAQVAAEEFVYHVLNRAAKRTVLFFSDRDYAAFEMILLEAHQRFRMRILAYCFMPNHWHFLLWPAHTKHLSEFMHWVTMTHARRWQESHQMVGTGAVYQGRYKAIPVQTERYFVNVCRYVERNPLRANLVGKSQDWRWSSLWRREHALADFLEPWPVTMPHNWTDVVNGVEDRATVEPIRAAITRGAPLGDCVWAKQTAGVLGMESTLRSRGRPKNTPGAIV